MEASPSAAQMDIDSERVKTRLASLAAYHSAKLYQRQKSSLQRQLKSYLFPLPQQKTLGMASPKDIISFLAWRDKFGKTVLHSSDCSREETCTCPKVLAAGTVDNNIGKLRSIFCDNDRGTSWNEELQIGNPAAHPSVRKYHSLVLEEQAKERIFPIQAVPIFLDKLKIICTHLRNSIVHPKIKSSERYILCRDLAFFSMDFFSGDRGLDLGRVKSSDLLSLGVSIHFLRTSSTDEC